jgi:hypothetical protein
MGIIRKNFRYKLIKNFLSKKELELGRHYFHLKHKRNSRYFDNKQNNNGDSMFYADCFSETILINKLKLIEKEIGLKLLPTYSYTRMYTYNAELKPHTDRPSCEISVTVKWDSDGTKWPIRINNKNIEMQDGDAVIYLGCEDNHSRDNFKGDFHLQTFLHYVDSNGPYKEYIFDKRNRKESPQI